MADRDQLARTGVTTAAFRRFIRREIIRKRSEWHKLALVAAGVSLAVGVRWLADQGQQGFPFATFSPVILLAAILLDWRHALLTAVASGLAVMWLLLPSGTAPAGPSLIAIYFLSIAILVVAGDTIRQLVVENEAHAQQAEAFNIELQHRTKNALQMMRALASRASRATDPAEFYSMLSGRLDALAKSNELLRFGVLPSCDMEELVEAVLHPFRSGQLVRGGTPCLVDRDAVTPLMMALHELCTNATKYGALSVETGRADLTWSGPHDGVVTIEWRETGGPPVQPPKTRGIGSRLLQAHGALSRVDLDFRRDGVQCHIWAKAADQ